MSTIAQIIALVDDTKPNAFSESVKVRWIAELDGKIAVDVFLMHHSETAQFNYKWPESMNTQPLVPFPHDDIYALWLEAKIDYANGEYNKYQNTMESYNESYGNFVRWFTRVHHPAQGCWDPQQSDATQYYITAYGLAVRRGFEGTLDDWLRSLIGPKGDPGKSPYEFACAGGFEGTEAEFLYKLLHDGKTAWEYAVEGGYAGTEAEFTALMGNAAAKTDIPKIDATLSAQGQAADAKETGERIDAAKTKMVKLWESAVSPGIAFKEQDVNILAGAYDAFVIDFVYSDELGHRISSFINMSYQNNAGSACARFSAGFLSDTYQELAETWRYASKYASGNTIHFGCGYRSGAIDNNACIPVAIYGIKW